MYSSPQLIELFGVMQSISFVCIRFVWGAYENQCGICGSYSWRVRQIFQEKKELTSYWMILWLKHQRALKLLNCLYVVAMTIFLRFILHKICSIKINNYMVIFKNLKRSQNLLLSHDRYVRIRWNSLCDATKMQHYLHIPTWCLIWNQTLRKGSVCEATFWKIHSIYIYSMLKEKKNHLSFNYGTESMPKNINKNLLMMIAWHCSFKA